MTETPETMNERVCDDVIHRVSGDRSLSLALGRAPSMALWVPILRTACLRKFRVDVHS